jgi:hypothetical protein
LLYNFKIEQFDKFNPSSKFNFQRFDKINANAVSPIYRFVKIIVFIYFLRGIIDSIKILKLCLHYAEALLIMKIRNMMEPLLIRWQNGTWKQYHAKQRLVQGEQVFIQLKKMYIRATGIAVRCDTKRLLFLLRHILLGHGSKVMPIT